MENFELVKDWDSFCFIEFTFFFTLAGPLDANEIRIKTLDLKLVMKLSVRLKLTLNFRLLLKESL